ncbi:hypothetical protein F183_A28810 [Bryobacterales bacterium F-183]|nr:hypothetical protein F183_A28810 [Bryobacterales bacterium F-183]
MTLASLFYRHATTAVFLLFAAIAAGQVQPAATPAPRGQLDTSYRLKPGDQITLKAAEMEELSEKVLRVAADGTLVLPVLGVVTAAGLTVEQLEALVTTQLRRYVRAPQVNVSLVQARSSPVFVSGAFKSPGSYTLTGDQTLSGMIAAAGGLQPYASRTIRLTRLQDMGPIPLAGAIVDAPGKRSFVDIRLAGPADRAAAAEDDILLTPYDVISAERAEMIYVTGHVAKAGAIELGEREFLSITKVISLSGGLSAGAQASRIKILRPVLDTSRRAEIVVNTNDIATGKASDYPVYANDVVFVPENAKRSALTKAGMISVGLVPAIILLGVR